MKASGVNLFFEELDAGLETVPQERVQNLGMTNVLTRPPYESLPQAVRSLIDSLDGQEPSAQLNLIHQFTNGFIKPEQGADNRSEAVQTFAQTLANPKGDCDDVAVFESGLIKYANERGVAHFDDVAVVGGIIQYNVTDVEGVSNDPLEHNFVVASQNGQIYYLDDNSSLIGFGDAAGGGFKSTIEDQNGKSHDTDVFVNRIDVVYGADGSVNVSPNAEIAADRVAPNPAPSIAPQPVPQI